MSMFGRGEKDVRGVCSTNCLWQNMSSLAHYIHWVEKPDCYSSIAALSLRRHREFIQYERSIMTIVEMKIILAAGWAMQPATWGAYQSLFVIGQPGTSGPERLLVDVSGGGSGQHLPRKSVVAV